MDTLLACYLIVAGLALVQSGLMLVHAWEHRRFYARRRTNPRRPETDLRVTLIAPCKGCDADLRLNLLSLFWQRYPRYELCFVVESESDPAVAVIRELSRDNPQVASRVVVAGIARESGQKVHNLMCAARALLDQSPAATLPDVLAFVDADASPHVDWLGRLVERLASGKHTVATGYRWYVPRTPSLANRLLSAINNIVIGLTGPHGFNLVWGGAWAIRTAKFRELGLPAAWKGSLSDDLVVSRLVREAGLRVGYEPHCLVKSSADFNWRSLGEFLRRQFLVVRVYAPTWWQFAFWTGLATNACLWGTLALAVYWSATRGPWAIPLAGGVLYYLAGVCRTQLAARAVRPFISVADEDYDGVAQLNVWFWPLVALSTWLAIVSAAIGRTITWRGICYRMDSPQRTTILENTAGPREELIAHARTTTRAA